MFVIVRDEDVPTVAGAVSALAEDAGLEAVPTEGEDEDEDVPTDLRRAMGLQDVRLSQADGGVVLEGLESLDIFEADEWAASLGEACSAEVIAIEAAEVGLLVHVFDEEAEPPITIVRKGQRWDTAALAPLTDTDVGEAALTKGLVADDLDALAAQLLAHLGATPTGDGVTLAFTDPLEDEDDGEPGLRIALFQATELRGKVEGPVTATGPLFSVRLVGVPEVEGMRVVLGGEGLDLLEVESLEAHVRTRGASEVVIRTITPSHRDDESVIFLLPDAYLAANAPALPALDAGDLFSAMQALVSATGQTMLNTLVLTPVARGKSVGDATLTITVATLARGLAAEGEVDIHVTK